MACEHKRIKSVNCVLYCMDCGAKLEGGRPLSFTAKPEPPSPEGEGKRKPRRTAKKKAEA